MKFDVLVGLFRHRTVSLYRRIYTCIKNNMYIDSLPIYKRRGKGLEEEVNVRRK